MKQAQFDKFAQEYETLVKNSTKASGENPDYFHEYKIKDLKTFQDQTLLKMDTILDLGSGVGNSISFLKKYFPSSSIIAIDVSEKSINIAKNRFPNSAEYVVFDGKKIPKADNSVDIVILCCVLHHIPHIEHNNLFTEILRILKPGQSIFIYEHNPLNPLTQKAVRDCPFDDDAVLIASGDMKSRLSSAGFQNVKVEYKVFFPKFLSFLRSFEKYLTFLPLGAQYRAIGIKPHKA